MNLQLNYYYSIRLRVLNIRETLSELLNIFCRPPRISKPPSARPFFNQSSVILDFYKGHLDAMVERASDADLSFVMYYAPWDAESQAVRHEFENVAQFYYSRVW